MDIERIGRKMENPTVLYAVTIALEIIFGYPRAALIGGFFALAAILLDLNSLFSFRLFQSAPVFENMAPLAFIGFMLGYANVAASILAYLGFGGGSLFTRFVLGAREPSRRERETMNQVFAQIVDVVDFEVRGFTQRYVLDSPMGQVNVIGTTLYVSSGAIRDRSLAPLIAHELGHLHHGDGSIILALRRLVFPLFYFFIGGIRDFSTNRPAYRPEVREFDAEQIFYAIMNKWMFFWFAFWGGGLGVWLMSWAWARYFSERDYQADSFVTAVGLKDELIKFLEQYKFFDTAVPYMLAWRPAHELRLDRLLPIEDIVFQPLGEEGSVGGAGTAKKDLTPSG